MRQATSSLQRIVKTAYPHDPSLPHFPGTELFHYSWDEPWDAMQALRKLSRTMSKQSDNPAIQKLLNQLNKTLDYETQFWEAQVDRVKEAMADAEGLLKSSQANMRRMQKNYQQDLLAAGLSPRAVEALDQRWTNIL